VTLLGWGLFGPAPSWTYGVLNFLDLGADLGLHFLHFLLGVEQGGGQHPRRRLAGELRAREQLELAAARAVVQAARLALRIRDAVADLGRQAGDQCARRGLGIVAALDARLQAERVDLTLPARLAGSLPLGARWLLGLLVYGGLLEIAQGLTPNRQAEWADLLADALGLLLALGLAQGWQRWQQRRRAGTETD